ncbi:MAG: glycosyltransferase [Cyclobacteriaceae bacterium]|nr:glycosyltransferase [Cyclobacteriaceae bacterium]
MDISIVIPVWNESAKIAGDLDAAIHFFESFSLKGEVIVSDDGSSDNTRQVAVRMSEELNYPVKIIRNEHHGKGHAVRSGILSASGDIILFIDSGSCIPYRDVWKGVVLIRKEACDIAHASRFLPESRIEVPKGWIRRISSYLFRKFVHHYMKIPHHLTDTQCGLKIYPKGIAHKLYDECYTRGFTFDIEIIIRAKREKLRIMEFPVTWRSDPDSRLFIFQSFTEIWKELRMIRRKLV